MSKIKDENYITIQGWMRTKLKLKGNELLIYAIIYGFSQKEDQTFKASLQYLTEWIGTSKQTILTNLKSLLAKKLIGKKEVFINNIKTCEYFIMNK